MVEIGSYLVVMYDLAPRTLWHERLVVGVLPEDEWYVIATPDGDVYEERLSLNSNDICGIHVLSTAGATPFGSRRGHRYYRFEEEPDANQWIQYCTEANEIIARWANRGGAVRPRAVAAPPRAPQIEAPPVPGGGFELGANEQWVMVSVNPVGRVGDPVPGNIAPRHVVGRQTLIELGGHPVVIEAMHNDQVESRKGEVLAGMSAEVGDLRLLPVRYEGGKRYRDYNASVELLEEEPSLDSFPDGPRTLVKTLRGLKRQYLTPQTFTANWVRTCEVGKGDRSVFEMEVIGEVLTALLCVDQLNVANLVGAEILARRRAVIIEAHRVAPGNPDYSASEIMMGLGSRAGGSSIEEALQKFTAKKLKERAAIDKEKRKASEEASLRKPKQNNKS